MICACVFTALQAFQLHSYLLRFFFSLLDLDQNMIFDRAVGRTPCVKLPCIASYTVKGVGPVIFFVVRGHCWQETTTLMFPLNAGQHLTISWEFSIAWVAMKLLFF